MNDSKKLQWACRRGMLELDVLLGNFLEEVYPTLSEPDQKLFVELLKEPDPLLLAWLMERDVPDDERIARIIQMIRNHARSRIHT